MSTRNSRLFAIILLAVLFSGAQACGSAGSTSNGSNTTSFRGTIAGSNGTISITGTLSVVIQTSIATTSHFSFIREAQAQSSGTVGATGTCIVANGGGTLNLSGTYNSSTGAMSISSSDGTSVFTGTVASNGYLTGTFTGPGGGKGGFSTLSESSGATVSTYCGTYIGSPDVGVFNVEVSSTGTLSGSAIPTNGQGNGVSLTGTVAGNSFSGTSSQSQPFKGTISGTNVSGTFQIGQNGSNLGTGTFSGSTSQCN